MDEVPETLLTMDDLEKSLLTFLENEKGSSL